MVDREKGEKMELQKCEYLENEKSFSVEIKRVFHNYLRAIIWQKNEKIAETSFKHLIIHFRFVGTSGTKMGSVLKNLNHSLTVTKTL